MAKVGLKTTDAVSVGLFGSAGPEDITVTKAAFQQKTSKGANGKPPTKYVTLTLNFNDSEGNAKSQDYVVFTVGKDSKGENISVKVTNGGADIEPDTEDKDAAVALQASCDYVRLIGSLKQRGFSEANLDQHGVFALNGIKGKAQREKLGTKRTGTDGKEYDDYGPLLFVSIDPKSVNQAAQAVGATAGGDDSEVFDAEVRAVEVVVALLDAKFKGNPTLLIAKAGGLLKAESAPDRTAVVSLLKSPEFWERNNTSFSYDGKVLAPAAA